MYAVYMHVYASVRTRTTRVSLAVHTRVCMYACIYVCCGVSHMGRNELLSKCVSDMPCLNQSYDMAQTHTTTYMEYMETIQTK
jgi:hypothetical protein